MANQDSSYLHSSANSFGQGESPFHPYGNQLVKFLHRNHHFDRPPYDEQQIPQSPRIVKRHNSQNTFGGHRSAKQQEKPNTFHNTFNNRFYQSIVQSINSKGNTGQFQSSPNLQRQLADYSAREISRMTELELAKREIKRLKEEIDYLTEKSQKLQRENQLLIGYKSKAQILNREYQNLLKQYNQVKNQTFSQPFSTHIPLSLEQIAAKQRPSQTESKFPVRNEVMSRIMPEPETPREGGNRVSWKKVAGVSPINRIQPKRNAVTPYDELPLIESKIDGEDEEMGFSPIVVRDQARTIDIKQFQKSRSRLLEKKCQQLQVQMMEIRRKNIELFKKCEEYQNQKLRNIEVITQLKYERVKEKVDLKEKETKTHQSVQKAQLELEQQKIKSLELEQQVAIKSSEIQSLRLEKEQIVKQLQKIQMNLERVKSEQGSREGQMNEMQQRYLTANKKSEDLQSQLAALSKNYDQKEIQNKFLEHELEEKKELIAQLERELKGKDRGAVFLQEESNLPQEKNQPHINTLVHQLALMRNQVTKTTQDSQMIKYESDRLKSENQSLTENYTKLTKIFEHEKQENMRLNELRESWRQIEARAKKMKQIDAAVDHLWQIKEVEYDNLTNLMYQIGDLNR